MDWKDSAGALLDGLFCNDEPTEESVEQSRLRERMLLDYEGDEDTSPITEEEIDKVIRKMKSGKASGWDKVEVEVLKRAWLLNSDIFVKLINGCWEHGTFPNEWKKAVVVTLLKSKDKNITDSTSYRPICLLPVLGKVMEGVILARLKKKCENRIVQSQFGFTKKKSTEDALHEFLNMQKSVKDKYILCLFLDISNAFNNLWWPAIIEALKEMECSTQLVTIIKDNLKKRMITFKTESGSVDREVNKGCPQGSILGPFL